MFSPWNYLVFFITIASVVSISFLVFANNLDIDTSGVDIGRSSRLTLINVLILTSIFTIVDALRRKYTVERPVKRILNATHRLTEGDFSVRIEPLHGINSNNELDLIINNLNTMAEELGGIETLRSDFIASVSHELKTPLAVIQNYATMMQSTALTEEKRIEYAKTISDASRKFSELVTNILKLNKLDNQQIYPEVSEYNLSEQLRECLLNFESVWEKKSLIIETDIDEDVCIKADAELLFLVWNNLISNAVKFTGDGGKILVSLKQSNGGAIIKVSDTGCGIAPEVRGRIFEKFYQGDNSHSVQGNGLGLALVKRVVDITGGEISVESTLGQGSTFTVKL